MLQLIKSCTLTALLVSFAFILHAQNLLKGTIKDSDGNPIDNATISVDGTKVAISTDSEGKFTIQLPTGKSKITARAVGYMPAKKDLTNTAYQEGLEIILDSDNRNLEEVVVSGTLKQVSKLDSPIPVEVFTAKFFQANPAPTIFESLQNINGVRPQINCSVCNTGDIHINGLEGPYTMVMIDGLPIVSGLSTVYGLNGIPQALIERVEIVKGPASTLYGSEAVGGLINIITKSPNSAPRLNIETFGTSWQEYNLDLGGKFDVGSAQSLVGANYFTYSNPIDKNGDNFTDVTLQNRFSLFNKWNFTRKDNKLFTLAGRYVYEDRWGGEMNWSRKYRGGDEVYGESIYTKRWELMGAYDLPTAENLTFTFSVNGHDQNSVYGDIRYLADQKIAFGQLTWRKEIKNHDLLTGLAYRYTYYNDNTPATVNSSRTHLPGLFIQDEITLHPQHKLLLGARYDYNSIHGSIVSPRVNYKWNSLDRTQVLRVGIGNGYRVANVFTEDHAALTGARDVTFEEDLKPETSWNSNVNYIKKFYMDGGSVFAIDASAFYTYFDNKIIPDYESDVNKIIYENLNGHAVSKGVSLNLDWAHTSGLKAMIGATVMDVYSVEDGVKEWQMLTEKAMGTWTIGYNLRRLGLTIDYTGNVIGPMRLPVLGPQDTRPDKSKAWSIQNIQLTKNFNNGLEIFGGVKNLLNWTPTRGGIEIISRAHDPFERIDDPNLLPFDPSYVYGPNQGIRGFLGLRYNIL
ncbi:outer membrane receptor for ferrienterochelin and colicins [Sphingobacterium alimentarium]|uniref:Outer membrane receptor for ferrienterochelin and colicins n=1 Tax=Sphingobacterium alimentarium TaxID=797292 RepID=A0A4R3VVH4_9SPHI|nr:TonB-dependent receptor [Sphingobacterium alimentarium]TCV19079.1 outer membrane receptor for ferrienterochelin and colicins [Sphingobacterium alimentarium]